MKGNPYREKPAKQPVAWPWRMFLYSAGRVAAAAAGFGLGLSVGTTLVAWATSPPGLCIDGRPSAHSGDCSHPDHRLRPLGNSIACICDRPTEGSAGE